MARTVSASEANQSFSRLLGEAEDGETIIIERRGVPVARLVPSLEKERERARRVAAIDDMIAYLQTLSPVTIERWTRDELYDDDPNL